MVTDVNTYVQSLVGQYGRLTNKVKRLYIIDEHFASKEIRDAVISAMKELGFVAEVHPCESCKDNFVADLVFEKP